MVPSFYTVKSCTEYESRHEIVWKRKHVGGVLGRVTIAVLEHHDRKQLKEEKVYFILQFSDHIPWLKEVNQAGIWKQRETRRPGKEAAYCSTCFLTDYGITNLGVALPPSKSSPWLPTGQSGGNNLPREENSIFPNDPGLGQIYTKLVNAGSPVMVMAQEKG